MMSQVGLIAESQVPLRTEGPLAHHGILYLNAP